MDDAMAFLDAQFAKLESKKKKKKREIKEEVKKSEAKSSVDIFA
jgi:hypothetical protein